MDCTRMAVRLAHWARPRHDDLVSADHNHTDDRPHDHDHDHEEHDHHGPHVSAAVDDAEPHDHDHDHDHDAGHDHDHDSAHDHDHGLLAKLKHLIAPHSHDTVDKIDSQLETSREGIRALWL